MRSTVIAAAVLAVGAVPAPASSAAAKAARRACDAHASRLVLANHSGKTVLSAGALFVCPRRARPFYLANQFRPRTSSSPVGGATRVALNARAVMYTVEGAGGELNGDDATLRVVDAQTKRTRFEYQQYYPEGGGVPTVGAALLCANGRAAFVFERKRSGQRQARPDLEVRLSRGRGTVLLARGPNIDPESLKGSDQQLRWQDGPTPHTRRVDCPTPRRAVAVPRLKG